MRVLLIDDERLALLQLEKMLRISDSEIEVMSFQHAVDGLSKAKEWRPDAVFLDIQMPEISGLEAAEWLHEHCPDSAIVFVTAHDEYAVKAFELNAIDYLLKPFTAERIRMTIERLHVRRSIASVMAGTVESLQQQSVIHCFKTIRMQSPGGIPEIPKWRTAKAQELFAYLLHHRGIAIHKSTIMELLSPEVDKKRAMTQLYTAIYHIRQCLLAMKMDVRIVNASIQESYMLEIGEGVTVDVEDWEKGLLEAKEREPLQYDKLGQLLNEYEADYLHDHDYVWAENERERFRQLWLHHARFFGQHLLKEKRLEEALLLYERIQAKEPFHEDEMLIVLVLLDKLGHYDKVVLYYDQIKASFWEELALSVPEHIQKWFKSWKQKH
ncbi:response regulator [Paenibacillus sp. GSMTC-2017]|uniref:response regulator n=1 Tax=Paenibacillus sp. GSMTC-2017 TaxID=2794350 RepID=UPI0018D7FEBC|nr:response regulator [Paenibacillus sp. GSMTC-2017]MBH5320655.1 response regulator [Paenibacillus sp. GSMTC-2017]